jgi:hypothetical protein
VEVELQAGGERREERERRPELLEEMGFRSAVDVTAMAIHPLRRKAESFVEPWRWRGATRRQQTQRLRSAWKKLARKGSETEILLSACAASSMPFAYHRYLHPH